MVADFSSFVDAQKATFEKARSELIAGAKRSHWIWYIFPQLGALGQSRTAKFYGIGSLDDARAYVRHPVLGPRLLELTRIVLTHPEKSPQGIFGFPDDLKFRSSMTLFALAAPEHAEFRKVLEAFYGSPDQRTLELLGADWPA